MRRYDNETLRKIYDRTSGYCHICGKKLSWANYARPRRKGAWEVEHSVPRAKGGTDHLNNLFAACVECNRGKRDITTRAARGWHGRTRAPLSREQRGKARTFNAIAGGIAGGLVGMIFGPVGVAIGAALGAGLGHGASPDRD